MTAKFGKSSVGCFIAFCLSLLFFALCNDWVPFSLVVCYSLSFWGFVLALLGMVNRESPKAYCIIGLVLNVALFVLLAFVVMKLPL